VLPYAGDHGLADEVLKCLGEGVGHRELAALAAETLAYCHGQDEDGFGPSFQSQQDASKCTGIKKKRGALSATAAASRELLLTALLRTPPEKVSESHTIVMQHSKPQDVLQSRIYYSIASVFALLLY